MDTASCHAGMVNRMLLQAVISKPRRALKREAIQRLQMVKFDRKAQPAEQLFCGAYSIRIGKAESRQGDGTDRSNL